jgi:hypothetical protein
MESQKRIVSNGFACLGLAAGPPGEGSLDHIARNLAHGIVS